MTHYCRRNILSSNLNKKNDHNNNRALWNLQIGWESIVPPFLCLSKTTSDLGAGSGRGDRLLHTTAHLLRGGARRTWVLFPEVNCSEAGRQLAHQQHAFPLPSQLLGKMKIPANQCLFSHSTNIPLSRLRLDKETALDWDSEMIIGGSVLLGLLF